MAGRRGGRNDGGSTGRGNSGVDLGLEPDGGGRGLGRDVGREVTSVERAGGRTVRTGYELLRREAKGDWRESEVEGSVGSRGTRSRCLREDGRTESCRVAEGWESLRPSWKGSVSRTGPKSECGRNEGGSPGSLMMKLGYVNVGYVCVTVRATDIAGTAPGS